ncbi:alpha/beta hydrolase family protein [Marinactinospora thermotolerans]|uniref:AB hydrolase-1 domain-containing protein n=1 Tax=Marinactinospora thermotolerans DSM 45154 TaxID=1122192 RepID=A0A1T4SMU9_9ACTN|nr:alpha/beta fold hydrolase [Marinactinospora thermotolerans]SKA29600.1 hypothetical protein SAMN02745673_03739 [Marinactinospora thermotolerans DSM 45154]
MRLFPRPLQVCGTLLTGGALLLSSACATAERDDEGGVERLDVAADEYEVEFRSGPDTLYGTFALPQDAGEPVPAALIVSGSGPTDRNGNSPYRSQADTNHNLAAILADAGIASLRYDKYGSGSTGTASRDPEEPVGYDLFEDEMTAAYAELASRPEVDPDRLVVIGHSEGSIFALRAPNVIDEHPPRALVLAAPVGERYLSLLDRQLTEQVRTAESGGALDAAEATAVLSDTRYAIARLRSGGELPEDLSPQLDALFSPTNETFLREIDAMDPVDLARELPADVSTLVLWGTADSQVDGAEVDRLMTGLDDAERVDLPDADHVFRLYDGSPGAPVLDEERPVSPELAPALTSFLDRAL